MAWVVAMRSCTYQNSPSSKHLDSPCLRTGSGGVIRYVYSIDHVTCSTYVCICAAAILVLLATFELTEWKGAEQCSGVFIRFKSPNSLFMHVCMYVCVWTHWRVLVTCYSSPKKLCRKVMYPPCCRRWYSAAEGLRGSRGPGFSWKHRDCSRNNGRNLLATWEYIYIWINMDEGLSWLITT